MFALVAGLAAAFGVDLLPALAAGVFVGLFVGGGLGLLIAGRMATRTD